MTKHDRLKTIPGCETWPVSTCRASNMATAHDFLKELTATDACDVVEAHFEARPADQIDAARLEALANKLGRIAHMTAREETT